jgi:hypothetical protein
MMRFHGVATKYLNNYLGWRRGIERWGEQITPCVILQAAMGGLHGETVLNFLTSVSQYNFSRILRHS